MDLAICAKFRIDQIDDNIFKTGIYPTIDTLIENQQSQIAILEKVIEHIDSLFAKKEIKIAQKVVDMQILDILDSEGFSINLTKNRFTQIEKELKVHL